MELKSAGIEHGGPQWRVVHVVPNHEKKVAAHLTYRSVEHFLPLYTERSRWSDRSVTLERPLFPGYIFIRFVQELRRAVISSPGVLKLLGKEESGEVKSAEIDCIRSAIANGQVLRPHAPIYVGTLVRVTTGVFAGAEGMVVELRSNCKVVISMSAVKQCYSLETDMRNLEILGKKLTKPEDELLLTGGYKLK
jgi:transcription antitermination factor NusG